MRRILSYCIKLNSASRHKININGFNVICKIQLGKCWKAFSCLHMLVLMVFSYYFAFWHQICVIDLYCEKFIEIHLQEINSKFLKEFIIKTWYKHKTETNKQNWDILKMCHCKNWLRERKITVCVWKISVSPGCSMLNEYAHTLQSKMYF